MGQYFADSRQPQTRHTHTLCAAGRVMSWLCRSRRDTKATSYVDELRVSSNRTFNGCWQEKGGPEGTPPPQCQLAYRFCEGRAPCGDQRKLPWPDGTYVVTSHTQLTNILRCCDETRHTTQEARGKRHQNMT
jgi:hypothetical protein